ncbi:MAG: glutamate 5-kinase, partial [Verrucomicrobium sp.]
VPIINENDSVAVEELKFGDNDKLSSRVAQLWAADLLILLTSVPGLMALQTDGAVKIVSVVEDVNSVLHLAQEDKGAFSVGGMGSKLRAVADAISGNVECIIASGRHPEQIADLVEGGGIGTRFPLPVSKV